MSIQYIKYMMRMILNLLAKTSGVSKNRLENIAIIALIIVFSIGVLSSESSEQIVKSLPDRRDSYIKKVKEIMTGKGYDVDIGIYLSDLKYDEPAFLYIRCNKVDEEWAQKIFVDEIINKNCEILKIKKIIILNKLNTWIYTVGDDNFSVISPEDRENYLNELQEDILWSTRAIGLKVYLTSIKSEKLRPVYGGRILFIHFPSGGDEKWVQYRFANYKVRESLFNHGIYGVIVLGYNKNNIWIYDVFNHKMSNLKEVINSKPLNK